VKKKAWRFSAQALVWLSFVGFGWLWIATPEGNDEKPSRTLACARI
jgi:hypothetical protein